MSSHPDPAIAQRNNRTELLRFCCTLCAADADPARVLFELQRNAVDWPALVDVANEFRLGPLLHRRLTPPARDLVPPSAAAALRALYETNRIKSLAMSAELARVLGGLASANIDVVAYKGPVFAAQLYGDVGVRTFSDLDVLIHERDVARATQAMLDAGYRAGRQLAWEGSFERAASASFDVHWSIAERTHQFPKTPDELLARRVTVDVAGVPMPAPCAEDVLLVTCFNGLTEDWQRLDRVADVAAVVRRHTAAIDWPALLALCRRAGCERIVLTGLTLARDVFQAELPACVERRLDWHRTSIARAGHEVDNYLRFAVESTDRRAGLDAFRFQLRMRERWRERLPYCQSMAYEMFRPKADDAPWKRAMRQSSYAVLRLPLVGVRRALIAMGHASLKEPPSRA